MDARSDLSPSSSFAPQAPANAEMARAFGGSPFDPPGFEGGDSDEDFASMFEESFANMERQGAEGEQVRGRVVKISNDSAFIDLGGKSEGIIDLHEFKDPDGKVVLSVGDEIEATIVGTSGDEGAVKLSKSFGKGPRAKEMAREMLQNAYQNRLAVEGKVVSRNKGGYEVTVAGMRCFVPQSQIDRYRAADPDVHLEQTYQFRIMEFREGGRNILLSRSQLQKEEAEARAAVLRETLKEGDVVTGKVRSIQSFGAFVDLGGLDGLLPISEVSYSRVKDMREVVNEGDTVTVQVLKFDKANNKLSFSLRALASNPWDDVGVRFVEGGIYRGKVMRLETFGAFVELEPGLEGLLHVSNMAWDKRILHPKDVVTVGDEVTVQVLSIDFPKRRLGLGMKQLGGDPWEGVLERFPQGALVEGTVEKIAPFGVFLTLEPGVTGLVPNAEMNTPRGSDHGKQFPMGAVVQVQVLECNPVERRISLSRKAIQTSAEKQDYSQYKSNAAQAPQQNKSLGSLGSMGGLSELLSQVKVKPMSAQPAAAKPAPAKPNAPAPVITKSSAIPAPVVAAPAEVAPAVSAREVAPATPEVVEAEAGAAAPARESRRILVRGKV